MKGFEHFHENTAGRVERTDTRSRRRINNCFFNKENSRYFFFEHASYVRRAAATVSTNEPTAERDAPNVLHESVLFTGGEEKSAPDVRGPIEFSAN